MAKKSTADVKKLLKGVRKVRVRKPGLSTGSTMLNLGLTGKPLVGFLPGKYYLLVGDSASGKTWLTLSCMAEAVRNPAYANHSLIFDNAEDGALMDLSRYFGPSTAKRIKAPSYQDGVEVYSETIEEFLDHLDDAVAAGPCIYVLDSMDALTSEGEEKKFQEGKVARRKGKESAGSYGDGKAKKTSSGLRRIISRLRRTGSILIVICQTRDNLGFGAMFEPKVRSGGRALKFYACAEMWTSIKKRLTKNVGAATATSKAKPYKVGVLTKIDVKKNRNNGKERSVEVPILTEMGIDDTGSCVDFLIASGHWKKPVKKKGASAGNKGELAATEFGLRGTRKELIAQIEEDNKEPELREIVAGVWNAIESKLESGRKPRYT